MKIFTDDVVYVQKNDIMYLSNLNIDIPFSIYYKLYSNPTKIDDSNKYEFIKYDTEEEIETFKRLDWIIDYNDVKDLTIEQLNEMGESVANQKQIAITRLNFMPPYLKKECLYISEQCKKLNYKMSSIIDIIWLKKGRLTFEFPDEVKEECQKKFSKIKK